MIEKGNLLSVRTGKTELTFNKSTGALRGVKNGGMGISFGVENPFTGFQRKFRYFRHRVTDEGYRIEIQYDSSSYTNWTIQGDGWIRLDYGYNLNGTYDHAGITFSYPEELVTGAKLLSNGPFRVWKNRLKGVRFGIHDKKYNNTVTGQSWDYPEFKGYYSGFYAAQIHTMEQPITILSATEDVYLHLLTPAAATNLKGVSSGMSPLFPSGNISILNGITPIGTKFSRPEEEGPQGEKNRFHGPFKGTLFFRFGD